MVNSGDNGVSPSESNTQTAPPPPPTDATSPVHHAPSPSTDHSGDDARPSRLSPPLPRSIAPDGSFWGRSDTSKTRVSARDPRQARQGAPSPPDEQSRGRRHTNTQDIATAIILSDDPTSPLAPSHKAAPEGRSSARKRETNLQRSTAHIVRTRSQVSTRTRPLLAEKPGLPTTRGLSKHSDTQKISQGSLTVGATQERIKYGRTDTKSAPTSQKDTKYPTQSTHYRLWGPGFLDVSLIP